MPQFEKYTADTAPEGSKETLKKLEEKFGFLPNIFAFMAESPTALKAFPELNQHVEECSLSAEEQQVARLAVSVENECCFCAAVHSTVLRNKLKLDDDVIDALRGNRDLPDEKLNALSVFAKKLSNSRGHMKDADVQAFLDAGYTKENVFDVILVVVEKTFTNTVNNLAKPELNDQFKKEEWSAQNKKAA